MRTGLFLCAVLLATAAAPAGMQERKKSDTDKPVITVTGCVDGSWLQVKKTDYAGSYATRYRLRGSKQLLKEVTAKYQRHLVEVTGKVTDSSDTTHLGKTIPIGKKTRITTGAKEVPQVPHGNDPSLEVTSYRDLQPTCG